MATVVTILLFLNRARLVNRIKQTELELQGARDAARGAGGRLERLPDAVIVTIHDRLLKDRRDLRRAMKHARVSGSMLLPLLAGSFLGIGYTTGALRDPGDRERMTAQFQKLEHELEHSIVKGRTLAKDFLAQATANATIAKQVEEYAREKEMLQDRLAKTEHLLTTEKKERMELEVLVGKAEQRLAAFEEPHLQEKLDADTFPSIEEPENEGTENPQEIGAEPDTTLELPAQQPLEESDLSPDEPGPRMTDATSLYRGMLDGQIAFDGRQRRSLASSSRHQIYVLVRWGESAWIVTAGRARVNSSGAVEGPFKVILPISTIRTLDVTAIATDKVYRRYQHVRLPDHKWKASTATIAVHRS